MTTIIIHSLLIPLVFWLGMRWEKRQHNIRQHRGKPLPREVRNALPPQPMTRSSFQDPVL